MKQPRFYSSLARTQSTSGGNLPHWAQACATFVTFRLADSLPMEKLARFRSERELWLAAHPEPWSLETHVEYHENFPRRFQSWLDAGSGSCLLRDERARIIVETCMRHFADIRYSLYAYVVKPNHVHGLFMPEEGVDGREIVRTWKSYTASAINRLLGRTGALWQKESYDRLIRNAKEFDACRAYIRQNDPQLAFDYLNELAP